MEFFWFACSDRKTEALADLKEELEHLRGTVQQLHQEKKELAEDAKLVRVYRDEIETLKVQSGKVEKLEADVVKYRQKAEDTEYLKKRIAVSIRTPSPTLKSFFCFLPPFLPPFPCMDMMNINYKCTMILGLEAAE